jgi:beta-galactosidase/beta-glucuronidase
MLGAAQGEIFSPDGTSIRPYKPFSTDPNAYFAGFSPMQQQAQQQAANMRVTPETGVAAGMTGAAGMSALGTQYNPMGAYSQQFGQQQAEQYMSPYMQNVVNVQQAAAQRQADIARTGRNAQAVQAGAFGGSRQAITDAEANRALADQQNAIQAQGLQSAFSQAQQQFNADQAQRMAAQQANIGQQQFGATLGMQGLQTGLQAAGQLGQLGQNIYGQQMGINQLQNQYGAQQQALEQAKINQQIQDYATAQQYPMLQLANMNALTRGLPMQSATTQIYQAPPSVASQLAGLGTAAYGLSQLGSTSAGTGSVAGKAKGGKIKEKKQPAGLAELALMKMQ